VEIGIHTFGELVPDPQTHQKISARERLKQMVRMAILADEVGLDIFGVGEHHRLDIAASTPSVVLAAVAQATKRIRLTSTATVLSTADPVRVFEEFATLDLISNGRAEIMLDVAPSSNLSSCLVLISKTTTTCLPKRSTC